MRNFVAKGLISTMLLALTVHAGMDAPEFWMVAFSIPE